jgi:poly(3-hydroxybutyrate) depolymerase
MGRVYDVGISNGDRMTLFLTLTLLAMFVVFGVDVRQKRRAFTRNHKL